MPVPRADLIASRSRRKAAFDVLQQIAENIDFPSAEHTSSLPGTRFA
jgi:hypothetical protein